MSNKKIPMRQCVGCHEMKAKREMIRVIKTAPTEEGETEIILDATGRKNGRVLISAQTVNVLQWR